MIKAFILCHPQSANLLPGDYFPSGIAQTISCGTSKVQTADLSEANDFFPTYASWNSVLFETSVILTIWEHAKELLGEADTVAILHSDTVPHYSWPQLLDNLAPGLEEARSIGLVAPSHYQGIWDSFEIPLTTKFLYPQYDPMALHAFDNQILIWDQVRRLDPDAYDYAMASQPAMIYSHQFACSRVIFEKLGHYLHRLISNMRLRDTGFWTPHVFERLLSLFLVREAKSWLTTAFWHFSSSGAFGPGEQSLYGPRPLKYYHTKIKSREGSYASTPKN